MPRRCLSACISTYFCSLNSNASASVRIFLILILGMFPFRFSMCHRLKIDSACLFNANSFVYGLDSRPFGIRKDELHIEAATLAFALLFRLLDLLLCGCYRLCQLGSLFVGGMLFGLLGCGTLGGGIE